MEVMPALKEEYDYYEYANSKKGTNKNVVSSVAVRKNTSVPSNNNKGNIRVSPTREETKRAIRVAMQDDNIGVQKKSNTANKKNVKKVTSKVKKDVLLEPVTFKKKEINEKPLQKPKEMTLKKPKTSSKAKTIAKQKAKVKFVLKTIFIGAVAFGMFFLICYRYSQINESFKELNKLKSTLEEKQMVNSQLESNIKQNTDLAYIESYAKYQLGMQKPKESQIRRINAEKQDKITTPLEIKEEEEKNVFEKFLDSIMELLDL